MTTETLPGLVHGVQTLLRDLVRDGAALGWVDPPAPDDIADLLNALTAPSELGAVRAGGRERVHG
jgi:hypothetical protein